jgi:hypothetical protein
MEAPQLLPLEVMAAIREVILDVNPVSCFTVQKQGFSFTLTSTLASLIDSGGNAINFSISGNTKLYMLVQWLQAQGATTSLLEDYVPLEYCSSLFPQSGIGITNAVSIKRGCYYSDQTICHILNNYCRKFYEHDFMVMLQSPVPYIGENYSGADLYDVNVSPYGISSLDRRDRGKMTLWCSYFLLEERRKNSASLAFLKNKNGDADAADCVKGDYRNLIEDTMTKIGDSFAITDKQQADGSGEKDFTALWGDKYQFLTKLQLYIRERYEKIFGDYSLRDNVMVSTGFSIEKNWMYESYANTTTLSGFADDLLFSNRWL